MSTMSSAPIRSQTEEKVIVTEITNSSPWYTNPMYAVATFFFLAMLIVAFVMSIVSYFHNPDSTDLSVLDRKTANIVDPGTSDATSEAVSLTTAHTNFVGDVIVADQVKGSTVALVAISSTPTPVSSVGTLFVDTNNSLHFLTSVADDILTGPSSGFLELIGGNLNPGPLTIQSAMTLSATSLDNTGTLGLGNTTATAVNIGNTSSTTTLIGTINLGNSSSATTVAGSFTVTNGVTTPDIDTSGALELGTSTATIVRIGRSFGGITVDGIANFIGQNPSVRGSPISVCKFSNTSEIDVGLFTNTVQNSLINGGALTFDSRTLKGGSVIRCSLIMFGVGIAGGGSLTLGIYQNPLSSAATAAASIAWQGPTSAPGTTTAIFEVFIANSEKAGYMAQGVTTLTSSVGLQQDVERNVTWTLAASNTLDIRITWGTNSGNAGILCGLTVEVLQLT